MLRQSVPGLLYSTVKCVHVIASFTLVERQRVFGFLPFVPSRCGAFAVVHVNMCSRVGSQHLISTDQPRLAAAVSQP